MTVDLLTTPSPRGVLDHTARFLADRPAGERTAAVVPRAYLKRALRDRLLEVEGGGGWLGARVLTFSELFEHYLNHLPGRPVLTASQVRQVVAALVRKMHAESEGRWFEGQVIGDRVSEATLRSLTRLLLELEPADLPVAELQERLAAGARSEELDARAREAVELFRRYRARLESEGGYLGPKGREVAAARAASEVPPPHGLRRFRVLGIDGQFPASPHVRWVEAAASHPEVERVEAVALLPDDLAEEAWALHANEPLYERWTAEGAEAARRLIDPGARAGGEAGGDATEAEEEERAARRVPPDLEALGRAPFAFRRAPAEAAGAVRGVRLPDEQLELDWVAGEVKRLALEEGVALEEIAVVARDMGRRAPGLERRLREAGVPAVSSFESRLTEVPAVRALLLAFRLPAEGWPARDLVALAESPYLLPDVSPAVLRRAARREEEPETGGGWVDRLTEMVEEVMEEADLLVRSVEDREVLETADALAAWVEDLRGLCGGDGEQPPSEWAGALARAVERWDLEERVYAPHARIDDEERLELARYDLDGLNRLLHGANDWLRGREVAGLSDLPMGASEFHGELREIASRERIRVSSYPRSAVHLVGPAQAGYREWSRVFVIGLVDGVFPSAREADEHLLTEEERRALSLPTRAQRSARERLLFQLAAGSARDGLTLTAPAADDRGKALVTSPYLTHLGLRVEGFEVEDLTAGDVLPEGIEDVRTERDAELLATGRYRSLTDDPAAGEAEVRERIRSDPLLRGWLGRPATGRARRAWAVARIRDDLERVLRENPWEQTALFEDRPAFGEYAGLFRPGEVPAWIRSGEAAFSPTAFRAYRACRFRFFLGTVLGLRGRLEEDGRGEAGAFGAVQHRILEELYRRFLEEDRLPPASGERVPELLEELEEVARAVLRETTGSGHPELWRLDRDVVVSLLRRFVAWDLTEMLRAERGEGYPGLRTRIVGLERRLGADGRPIGVEALGERFRLRGTIDRIEAVDDPRLAPDHRAANGSLVVLDYKTGRWARQPGPEQFLEGESLQLPLYARMLRRHQAEYGDGPRHVYGFGVLATADPTRSGRLDVRRVRGPDQEGTLRLAPDRELGDNPVLRAERAALREAGRMVKQMRAGRFAPSPDADAWSCPMGELCCRNRRGGAPRGGGRRRFELPLRIDREEYRRIADAGPEDGDEAGGGEAAAAPAGGDSARSREPGEGER